MKILIACDKFKGSLNGTEVCANVGSGISESVANVQLTLKPTADGGDGSMDILADMYGCDMLEINVFDAAGHTINSQIGYNSNTKTAILEMASYTGLAQLAEEFRNPANTSSFGLGQAIKAAADLGATEIIIGIGGSATNDGGAGMLEALGYEFYDENDRTIHPKGGNLNSIVKIVSPEKSSLPTFNLTILSDVDNPVCGESGATFTYARQKGASSEEELNLLEENMLSYASLVQKITGTDVFNQKGYGAAGGIPLSACSFLDAKLVSGSEFIFNKLELDELIQQSDVVVTGEGKVDGQSLHGKAISPIVEAAKKYNKQIFVVCGIYEDTNHPFMEGIEAIEISSLARTLEKDSFRDAAFLTVAAGREISKRIKN